MIHKLGGVEGDATGYSAYVPELPTVLFTEGTDLCNGGDSVLLG